ncbi:hypothetical protein TUBRATIS_28750 [Tubulinosema ratisbonensis]|uniref:Uncharacterized protein n=1 Tax=Tubulinosema ratisbonensis TaxID=291195 RepID=A0A437AHR6_9MICR|nr:hypothetical protein TUBRATIS_28750 [Tubulinosema ratisbonensis]
MNKIKDALQVKAYPIRCELINQSDTQKDSSTQNAVGYKCYTDPQEIIQALINVGYEPDANGRIIATGCRGDEKVEVVYDTKEDPDREPLEGNVTPVNLPEPVK